MKIGLKLTIFILTGVLMFLASAFFTKSVVYAQNPPATISATWTNGGDSVSTITWDLYRGGGSRVTGSDIYGTLTIGPYGSGSLPSGIQDNPDAGSYYLIWTAAKLYNPDSRDVWCKDPKTDLENIIFNFAYNASISYSCYIPYTPPTPPPGEFDPNNNPNPVVTCLNATTQRVQFYWSAASNANSYTIYWTSDGSDPRTSGTAQVVSGVSSGYFNDTFSLGGNTINWDVKASNGGGDTWTTNGTFSFQTKTSAQCAPESPPTVDLKVNSSNGPISVASGTSVNLTWSLTNSPISCSASNNQGITNWNTAGNNVPSSATLVGGTGPHGVTVSASTTFSLTCTNGAGSVSDTVTVNVNGVTCSGPTSGTINTSYSFTASGGASYTWSASSSSNPSTGAGAGFTTKWSVSGSQSVTVTSGSQSDTCYITINVSGGAWALTFSQVCNGGNVNITFNWTVPSGFTSTYMRSDVISNFIPALAVASPSSGTATATSFPSNAAFNAFLTSGTSPITARAAVPSTYPSQYTTTSMDCTLPPTVDLKANNSNGPISVAQGSTVSLSWTTTNVPTSCTASATPAHSLWTGAKAVGGSSQNLTVSVNTTFVLTCTNTGGTATDSVTVNALPPPTVNIMANNSNGPISVAQGSTVSLSWTTTNSPTSCSGSGAWSGPKAAGGGSQDVIVNVNSTFTITCSKAGFSNVVDSVVVNVFAVPTNLTVSGLPACASSAYTMTFNWTNSAQSGWAIDVDSNNNFADGWLATKLVSSGTSTPGPAGFNNGLTLLPGVNYDWRIFYTVPNTWVTGPDFSVPECLDLKARFVQPFAKQVFSEGETANLTVRVFNVSSVSYAGGAAHLGFWPTGGGPSAGPTCTPSTPPVGQSYAVPAINADASVDIPVTFNVGSSSGIANAFVLPACSPSDSYWTNNHTSGAVGVGDSDVPGVTEPGGFTYTVSIDAWFETKGGDVGAATGIATSAANPASKYQSDYLLIGNALDANVASAKWKISGYTGPLMPAGAYSYLADRFKSKAQSLNPEKCDNANINGLVGSGGLAYCATGISLNNGHIVAGKNIAWFIDGDLTITGNVIVDSPSTIAFIVSGNITVNTDVTRIDGLYIAGGTFSDTTDAADVQGRQLIVNGSAYAGTVNLGRKLGGVGCSLICNNATDPAESFQFDPRYLVNLGSLIASPSVNWQEVAP